MDHGIEKPEERISKGKVAAGSIRLRSTILNEDSIEIEYSDDGAGLNLDKIANLAKDSGLKKDGHQYDDEEVANFIFVSGLLTKDES